MAGESDSTRLVAIEIWPPDEATNRTCDSWSKCTMPEEFAIDLISRQTVCWPLYLEHQTYKYDQHAALLLFRRRTYSVFGWWPERLLPYALRKHASWNASLISSLRFRKSFFLRNALRFAYSARNDMWRWWYDVRTFSAHSLLHFPTATS